MKNLYHLIVTLILGLGLNITVNSQCLNTSSYGSGTASSSLNTTVTLSTCNWALEYATVFNIVSGYSYRINSTVSTDYVTVRSNSSSGPVVYFGLQGTNWTAPSSGTYYVHFNTNSSCGTSYTCRTTSITTVSTGAPAIDPCTNAASMTCGSSESFILSGSGAWSNFGGPYSTPGKEKIFSFTATTTGIHNISISNSEYYVDLFYKSGNCSSSGWNYVDDIYTSATNSVNLTSGTTYYFLIDDENTSTSNVTMTINCPTPPPNPCNNAITNINNCGNTYNYNLVATTGVWNNFGGPYSTPGTESIFRFSPTVSGNYEITVTHNNGGWVDLFYKTQGGPCSSMGWSFIDDIYSNVTNTVYLQAGTTYQFLLDDEDTYGSSGTFSISCPCIAPTNGIDFTFSAPFNHSNTTINACNDCSFRSSNDRTYEISLDCDANYTFSLCGGATWDTYLYLSTVACGGSIIASNDDNCSLQSSISSYLAAGTYYLTIEGFSSTSEGSYSLEVTGGASPIAAPLITTASALVCEQSNASYTASGVTGAVSYDWLVTNGTIVSGQGTSNITVDWNTAGQGTVSVTVSNSCFSTSSSNMNITVAERPTLTFTTTNVSCFGLSDGEIIATSNPTNVVYSLNSGQYSTGNTFNNLSAGSYFIMAMLDNIQGCVSNSNEVIISQPDLLESNLSYTEILCFGESSTVIVDANGGTQPYVGTGNFIVNAGNYNYIVTDANGCQSTSSVSISEPDLLIADAGDDAMTYFGYSPTECTTLSANSSGGTGVVNYEWSNGDNSSSTTVCPSTSTIYTITVTDENGCTASDEVNVCVIDVICFAGNSSNQKVEVCHNGNTICINASAVPAHLAHGCNLGSCDEMNDCNNSRLVNHIDEAEIKIYPNPTLGILSIDLNSEMEISTIKVYNAIGELIDSRKIYNGTTTIDLSFLSNGLYFIQLNNEVKPFIKE